MSYATFTVAFLALMLSFPHLIESSLLRPEVPDDLKDSEHLSEEELEIKRAFYGVVSAFQEETEALAKFLDRVEGNPEVEMKAAPTTGVLSGIMKKAGSWMKPLGELWGRKTTQHNDTAVAPAVSASEERKEGRGFS